MASETPKRVGAATIMAVPRPVKGLLVIFIGHLRPSATECQLEARECASQQSNTMFATIREGKEDQASQQDSVQRGKCVEVQEIANRVDTNEKIVDRNQPTIMFDAIDHREEDIAAV